MKERLNQQWLAAMPQSGCQNYMTIYDRGALGNQMCEYVSLLGISSRLGYTPVLSGYTRKMLDKSFPNIDIRPIEQTK